MKATTSSRSFRVRSKAPLSIMSPERSLFPIAPAHPSMIRWSVLTAFISIRVKSFCAGSKAVRLLTGCARMRGGRHAAYRMAYGSDRPDTQAGVSVAILRLEAPAAYVVAAWTRVGVWGAVFTHPLRRKCRLAIWSGMPVGLSEEQLREIEARLVEASNTDSLRDWQSRYEDDIPLLLVEVRRLREEEVNWRVQVDGFRSEVARLRAIPPRVMSDAEIEERLNRGGGDVVRKVIAHEIGQTVIDGFRQAGLATADAMYTALHMARELPYEKLRHD